jgi:formate C-acetyltransferase
MEQVITEAVRRARTDLALREMTPRTRQHYDTIKKTMHKRQSLWGGTLTVLSSETEKLSATIRRSLAFEKVMVEMPIVVEPFALLAGNCMENGQIVRCMLPDFILEHELGQCCMYISHKCPDYETLLESGISGILAKLESNRTRLEAESGGLHNKVKLDFYEAVKRECLAVIALSNRYAALAEQSGLLELARICRKVPEHGAESFHEAAQSMWFFNHCIHQTMTNLSIGHIDHILNPYFEKDFKTGRITLERAQEIVDEFNLRVNDRAQIDPDKYVILQDELIGAPERFMVGYGQGFVSAAESDQADAINHWGQNILLSGLRADGSDDTNVLTYMFLNAHEKFAMTAPVLTVRLHKNSPPELVERVAEVLKTGGGMPYINNDDVIVPAYEKLGVSREDACDYANSNCWETLIQGRSNQEMIRFINFLYLLELALNNGKPTVRGKPSNDVAPERKYYSMGGTPGNPVIEGVATGDAACFSCMDDIMVAWKKQMEYMLDTSMRHVAEELEQNGSHGPYSSIPILSAVTRDCVESMTDLTHNGARYTLWHMMAEAVSNAADAMAAIQKFVYEEKLVTLPRLVEILNSDWEGEDELHRRFINDTPRFGNGFDSPDSYAAEMVAYFVERVSFHAKKYTICIYSPCIGTFSWIISIGKNIGASADGRKSREPIAANMSPVPGADISGITAAIHSYLKLQTGEMAAGAPIDLRIDKRGLDGEEGTKRIAALIKTFIQQGGNMMTLTVTSADELRKAIAEPEKYQSLRVRMGGWSAYFVMLSKEAQKIQLRRAEHGF